ncbi:MAG: hypothetical protein R3213_07280 [Flavobacteriaceae bacterium]|nr:hypothetical protein [Flavobacteriaceae bacterium]
MSELKVKVAKVTGGNDVLEGAVAKSLAKKLVKVVFLAGVKIPSGKGLRKLMQMEERLFRWWLLCSIKIVLFRPGKV